MMDGQGKSDRPVVPMQSPKLDFWEFTRKLYEATKGRGLAKENADPATQDPETQHSGARRHGDPDGRHQPPVTARPADRLQQALERIRQAACRDRKLRFTTLWHHVYDAERLGRAYFELQKWAAPGVDGRTWTGYGEDLDANLQDLSERLIRGTYKARPVKRVYIPKADGRQRPIGVPVLEDKIVQRATVAVLNAVYDADFKRFSYGFRPGSSAHMALDALAVGIQTKKVNWVLDADIKSFFDTLDHQWLMKFVEHRIADPMVLRHIRKWLKAGVMDAGKQVEQEEGTPQGGSISPLLANIYLHYVLDLWADQWRRQRATGDVILVRYADDFVVGFEQEADARRFLEELRERFRKFNLELHETKTRIIAFGAKADENHRKGGGGKPATFDFLGFTHCCGRTRRGRFVVLRLTMAKRMRAKLKALKEQMKRRMHEGIDQTGKWLAQVLRGHIRYFGVPRNSTMLWKFSAYAIRLWRNVLNRRDQSRKVSWARMARIVKKYLPNPRICQPYPEGRLCVIIQGKSPVR